MIVQGKMTVKQNGADSDQMHYLRTVIMHGICNNITGFNPHMHFFMKLAGGAFRRRFTRLNLAAGKFPIAAEKRVRFSASDEDPAISVFKYRRGNFNHTTSIGLKFFRCQK